MNLVKTATRMINLTHVASIERSANGELTIHYAVPRASVVSGVSHPTNSAPPVATDHYGEWQRSGGDLETDCLRLTLCGVKAGHKLARAKPTDFMPFSRLSGSHSNCLRVSFASHGTGRVSARPGAGRSPLAPGRGCSPMSGPCGLPTRRSSSSRPFPEALGT
jgi:hypothetical protein